MKQYDWQRLFGKELKGEILGGKKIGLQSFCNGWQRSSRMRNLIFKTKKTIFWNCEDGGK